MSRSGYTDDYDDDGDSRRLQVDVEIDLLFDPEQKLVTAASDRVFEYDAPWHPSHTESWTEQDKHAATRLAVLNCAVATGEAME